MRDVVVIGGGPAGLHAAYMLAASGLDVVVFESQAKIGDGAICSGVIGAEAFPRLNLPSRPVLSTIHCIQALSPAGQVLEHKTDSPLAFVVDKSHFNRTLAERAQAAGVDLCLAKRMESVERTKHGLRLSFSSQGGSGILTARVVIIASGVNSTFNRILSLARPSQYLRAIQCDVALPLADPLGPTKVYVGRSVAPGGFGWKIPLGDGRFRFGLMATHEPKSYFTGLLHRVAPEVDQSQLALGRKGIAQGPVGGCVAERTVVIGEAAGHVKTSTGGGIYYGMLSAEFAVEAILRAFRKSDFTSLVLADFERYWRTHIGHEIRICFYARNLAACIPDRVIEKIFGHAASDNLLARLNGRLKFDWHYRAVLATLRTLSETLWSGLGRPIPPKIEPV